MQLYFDAQLNIDTQQLTLDSVTSKHLVQVLRMKNGAQVELTNGNGLSAIATIIDADKWNCKVQISNITQHAPRVGHLAVAVSFTKNKSRNEWMLEKLTEIGVSEIIPINCSRTEKEKINAERVNAILISAMLQSKQYFLPAFAEVIDLKKLHLDNYQQRFVAHCIEDEPKTHLQKALKNHQPTIIFIGPEGDFTPIEIEWLIHQQGCLPISLGENRLRTETAAIYAATIFNAYVDA